MNHYLKTFALKRCFSPNIEQILSGNNFSVKDIKKKFKLFINVLTLIRL